jgi:hypothetical protein
MPHNRARIAYITFSGAILWDHSQPPNKTNLNAFMALTNEQVVERARDWAQLHSKEKTRSKMDEVLEGLSSADQRRVYLCGQRIAAGLSAKVIPAAQPKEASNGKKTKPVGRTSPAKQSARGNKK